MSYLPRFVGSWDLVRETFETLAQRFDEVE